MSHSSVAPFWTQTYILKGYILKKGGTLCIGYLRLGFYILIHTRIGIYRSGTFLYLVNLINYPIGASRVLSNQVIDFEH
jgi:hypothetical protein